MEYDDLPRLFLTEIPGFEASPEFALVADDSDLPGVVVAAVGRYLVRLEQKGADGSEAGAPNAIYDIFERMATSSDENVQNALQVEVFESLDPSRSIGERIVSRLGPNSRALYSDWA